MIKSIIGIAVAAAALVLAISPEARKSARKYAVIGTEALLDMNDQLKRKIPNELGNDHSALNSDLIGNPVGTLNNAEQK